VIAQAVSPASLTSESPFVDPVPVGVSPMFAPTVPESSITVSTSVAAFTAQVSPVSLVSNVVPVTPAVTV